MFAIHCLIPVLVLQQFAQLLQPPKKQRCDGPFATPELLSDNSQREAFQMMEFHRLPLIFWQSL